MSCAICETRKEKRFCPAVHGRICAQCCGELREVTLDCPSDCVYLQQAREHEKPRSLESFDQNALFPSVETSEQFLYEHDALVMGISFALTKAARRDRNIKDSDLTAALSSLARSYETLINSGLHVPNSPASTTQQAIVSQLQDLLREYRQEEEKHLGYARLRDSEVLRVLVFWLRMAHSLQSGRPLSRAFIDFLYRRFPEKESSIVTASNSESRIIVR